MSDKEKKPCPKPSCSNGRVTCKACDGKGGHYMLAESAGNDNSRWISCNPCSGSGKITCNVCRGTGNVDS